METTVEAANESVEIATETANESVEIATETANESMEITIEDEWLQNVPDDIKKDILTPAERSENPISLELKDEKLEPKQGGDDQLKETQDQSMQQPQHDGASGDFQENEKTELCEDVKPLSVDTQPQQNNNQQMQFPFAPSNFLAPSPTPIRPLDGDPRAMKQQPLE
ncbi:Chromodomain containing hypothetical protein, partial [Phytophthora palmivora]